MRLPGNYREQNRSNVAMTPMIDVVFLLLIFFVCTASFEMVEEILPTNLATAGATDESTDVDPQPQLERIVIKLRRTGEMEWIVNDQPQDSLVQVQGILLRLASIDRSLPVILDSGKNVPVGELIDVYDLSRLAGFEKIQFAASVDG